MWLGIKAINALNVSNKLAQESHKNVIELVKMGMYEGEALECQDNIISYPYVPQELWPSKNNLGKQNFHHTQIPSEIEIYDGFAMDYHIALFFELEEMIVPKEEALINITKKLKEMRIPLGDDISDPIAIMYTHGGKQWSGHAKIHLKMYKNMVFQCLKDLGHSLSGSRIINCIEVRYVNLMIPLPQARCYRLKSPLIASKTRHGTKYMRKW